MTTIKVKPLASLRPGEAPDSNTLYTDSSGALVTVGGGSGVSVAATETNWATSYGYTDDRITSETRTAGSVTQTRAYTYDAAGNLTGIGAWA